jgi:predicted Zn-dependent protease
MTGLIGPEEVRRVADAALSLPRADGVEVLFMHEWGGLTRFASSSIHQSTHREDTGIRVRVVSEGRIGVAASNDFSLEGARRAAESALEMATVVAPDALFPGLAPPVPTPRAPRVRRGGGRDHALRTRRVRRATRRDVPGGFHRRRRVRDARERGRDRQHRWTVLLGAVLAGLRDDGRDRPDGGSGFAEVFAAGRGELDPAAVGKRAADKAVASRSPRDSTRPLHGRPGAGAVSTLVGFLAWVGFGGRSLHEGRSCFSGKQGEQVASPIVTIYDDALSEGTLGLPFDFEGVPRSRVDLIGDGVFLSGVYDLRTAKQAGTTTTGHALPPPNPEGPFPLNLFMAPGEASLQDMIASTDHGLLVTRFHYTNIVHPVESTITGHDAGWHVPDRGRGDRPSGQEPAVHPVHHRGAPGHPDGGSRHRARERVLLLGQPRPRPQGLVVQLQRAFGPLTA